MLSVVMPSDVMLKVVAPKNKEEVSKEDSFKVEQLTIRRLVNQQNGT
jgi:hypothetical protein